MALLTWFAGLMLGLVIGKYKLKSPREQELDRKTFYKY